MNLQNPVAFSSFRVQLSHPFRIIRMNVQRHFIVRNSLVRELPQEMPGDWSAIFPAIILRQFLRVAVKLRSCNVGMTIEIFLALEKSFADVFAKFQLERVGTQHERSPEICFPLFEYRAQI